VDFSLLNYSGREHPMRFAGNTLTFGGVKDNYASTNVLVAYGKITRNYTTSGGHPAKEPITFRYVKNASLHNVEIVGGHALRIAVENTLAEGARRQSKNVYIRRNDIATPIWIRWQGVDVCVVEGNTFRDLNRGGMGSPPMHVEWDGDSDSWANVDHLHLMNNKWVGGNTDDWVDGNPGSGFVSEGNVNL
jgi:hypothetical protein